MKKKGTLFFSASINNLLSPPPLGSSIIKDGEAAPGLPFSSPWAVRAESACPPVIVVCVASV
jgi:hypothetical protein